MGENQTVTTCNCLCARKMIGRITPKEIQALFERKNGLIELVRALLEVDEENKSARPFEHTNIESTNPRVATLCEPSVLLCVTEDSNPDLPKLCNHSASIAPWKGTDSKAYCLALSD